MVRCATDFEGQRSNSANSIHPDKPKSRFLHFTLTRKETGAFYFFLRKTGFFIDVIFLAVLVFLEALWTFFGGFGMVFSLVRTSSLAEPVLSSSSIFEAGSKISDISLD